MKKAFYFLLFIFYSFPSHAQTKLVVGIVVDQMRYDYIDKYWSKFGNGGFKRMVNEGYFCRNTNYNYVPTFTGPGHASVYTGTIPAVHGIISNQWVDREAKKDMYCVQDPSVAAVGGGNNSAGQMSPKNLISSTVGEELKKISAKSKVIGIALKDRGAILPAGHNADAAYWYDGGTGNWISSTYYMSAQIADSSSGGKKVPQWLMNFNRKELAKTYLSQPWRTIIPIDQYTESDADDNSCEGTFKGKEKPTFPYDLPALMKDNGGLGLIRVTPFGNSFTKDFAIETIKNENLGKGTVADFLCLSFSSPDYIGHQFGPQSVEVEDCYIRLDKDLAELFRFLDEWAGKSNTLVFLTADHGASESVPCLWKKNISAGVIHESSIADSLKKFFLKTYNDSLLMAVADFDVYLDRKKIEAKKLKLEDVQNKTAQYLLKINGIADALTAAELQQGTFQDSIRSKVKAGFYSSRSGDVTFVLKRNWIEGFLTGTTHGSPYSYDTHVPLLWWGGPVRQGSSREAITITQIAPTLSKILQIPVPSGCQTKPISSLIK